MCMDSLPTQEKCCYCCPLLVGSLIVAGLCLMSAVHQPFECFASKDTVYVIKGQGEVMDLDFIDIDNKTNTFQKVIVVLTSVVLGIGSILLFCGALMQVPILILLFQWAVVFCLPLNIVHLIIKSVGYFAESYVINGSVMILAIFVSIVYNLYIIFVANSHRMFIEEGG